MAGTVIAETPTANAITKKFKMILDADSVKDEFRKALGEKSALFATSLLNLFSNDKYLQECEPGDVIKEGMKAAVLGLPIEKSLGFAYVVAYKKVPTFIMGYRGYIQLAQRTGLYRFINADVVYEGELSRTFKLTGEVDLSGQKKSDNIAGYFAYFQLLNGFEKCLYMTREDVIAHAEKYSPSYKFASSAWKTDFDSMALKTPIRALFSKYAPMSIEMANAFAGDSDYVNDPYAESRQKANKSDVIDIQETSPIKHGSDDVQTVIDGTVIPENNTEEDPY
ncbi:MAG: recombinase RecT [Deferribacterales bacterium]